MGMFEQLEQLVKGKFIFAFTELDIQSENLAGNRRRGPG